MSNPTNALPRYKSLWRRIGQLPLDIKSLDRLRRSVRNKFRSHSKGYSSEYHKFSNLIDNVLVRHNYAQIQEILDEIYKESHMKEPWKFSFVNVRYNRWKPVWPQVHLIEEFASEKHVNKYNKELDRQNPVLDFSFVRELGLEVPQKCLSPLNHNSAPTSELEPLLVKMRKFYNFLQKNSSTLMSVKLRPLEVIYEPSRFGIPTSVAYREYLLRTKITYMKMLLSTVRPVEKEDLHHLISVATGEGQDTEINPYFFRHMLRARRELSPIERKYLMGKNLIPDTRGIRFWYREYVMRQFYEQDGTYCMSPMVNFYG